MGSLSTAALRLLARELRELQEKPCEGIRLLVNEQDLADVAAELDGPAGTPYAGGVFRMRLSLPSDFPESPPKGWFTTKIWCGARCAALPLGARAAASRGLAPLVTRRARMRSTRAPRGAPRTGPARAWLGRGRWRRPPTRAVAPREPSRERAARPPTGRHPNVSKSGEICVNVLKKDWKPDLGLRHVLLVIRCLLIEPFPESALNEDAGKALLEDYAEYCKHARLMTELHAAPPKRPMPLATASGANADGGAGGGGAGGSGGGGGECGAPGSPAVKKPKAAAAKQPAAALAKKKSLKRL
jgi:ubiquitin-protein ligase